MKLPRPTHPWTKTNMIRLYGWAEVGQRLVDEVPHGHWNTSTFIAGLRQDGLIAPCVFNGPINGELFLAYVGQFWFPRCRRATSWSWTIWVPTRTPAIPRAIEAVGAKLFYLPSYSPDLNPIEQAFAKLKTLLRKANARSFEQVQIAIARLLKAIAPHECRNFFAHAGYAST